MAAKSGSGNSIVCRNGERPALSASMLTRLELIGLATIFGRRLFLLKWAALLDQLIKEVRYGNDD
jgi:hypothetical protein